MIRRCLGVASLASFLVACADPAAPPPATPAKVAPAATAASASATGTVAPPVDAPVGDATIRFDDLGISFVVPSAYRVVGDDEVAARAKASATPKVADLLKERLARKTGFPLLTLARRDESQGSVAVMILVVRVPAATTPVELMAAQQKNLSSNLDRFEVVGGPRETLRDTVPGSELVGRHQTRTGAVRSTMQLFVRGEIAYVITANTQEAGAEALSNEVDRLRNGVHFYAPPQ